MDVGAGLKGFGVGRGWGAGCGLVALLEVRPRLGWRGDCECRCQRSCVGEPVHGCAVSLLPELSTLPRLQLPAVPTTVGGSHTSAQTRTQKSLAVGRCPLLTLSGRALAFLGQHGPESGRASSFETAPVSKGWDAHSRGGHVDSSWATPLRKWAGHDSCT